MAGFSDWDRLEDLRVFLLQLLLYVEYLEFVPLG